MNYFLIKILLMSAMSYSLIFAAHDHTLMNPRKALYGYYFMIKECINSYILFTYFVDHKKVEQAKIVCCACNHAVNSQNFYAYLAANVKPILIRKLIRIVTLGSAAQIAQFLFDMHEKYKIACPVCRKYIAWRIFTGNAESA
ncbi:hypothetical protein A3J41_01950 [candidate division TM6 bacterium RIFCSPHIGHO2_12_FULL_38_8]|nr:MAG: hypothetical protein A3J41_01950 [candidate division TM6 bacterium RIFCSPHIGHO2_12_FULL_38_8]